MTGSALVPGTGALKRAEVAQRIASDPKVSAFVWASAGSGKTKLLTDRLLRLMLAGCDPARILCLTFTRAAAAEMAGRLNRRLGEWVVLGESDLDARLARLGVIPDPEVRARARSLFAEVLDLPGGMRISTIHAFCQSLLRRFPLEAAVSPHFEIEAEEDRALALEAAERRAFAATGARALPRDAIERLAPVLGSFDRLGEFLAELVASHRRFEPLEGLAREPREKAFRRAAGAAEMPPDRAAVAEEPTVRGALEAVVGRGATAMASRARCALDWLALASGERREKFDPWRGYFFTTAGAPRALSGLVNPVLARAEPGIQRVLESEQRRLLALLEAETAGRCARISADLYALALPVLRTLSEEKALSGRLDYGDLIHHANGLLADPGAAWVLYKLDGGIDHLLLDEAQDTAPEQWAIADALSAEFFAGAGAGNSGRTLFAVGDPKQSIFSFQGADPAGFGRWRERLRERVTAAREQWREPALEVSFRSTSPVLELVDAVFKDAAEAAGGGAPGGSLHHDPVRIGQAGSVELWPLAPASEAPELAPWEIARKNLNESQVTAPTTLALVLARWIGKETAGGVRLASRDRALAPGDVLVLVRRRNAFSRTLVRALKEGGVPAAGLDRLALTEEPAVQDLRALCATLLLPEDDLTFAEFLTSPLGGLTDDDLLALCPGRPGPLFQALAERAGERPAWQKAWDFFAALRSHADYVSPHALLVQALSVHGGRARLYARLGVEAADPIDELLNAALRYEGANPPSLQGFLHWLDRSGAEVKRQPDEAASGLVRVMTVHGAKGLQAPLVILPDTTSLPPAVEKLWPVRDPLSGALVPLIAPTAEYRSEPVRRGKEERRRVDLEEYNRLLYVALTRAEDRLVIAGWKMGQKLAEDCWYRLIERGFSRLAVERRPFTLALGWAGERLSLETPQEAPPVRRPGSAGEIPVRLPEWAGCAPYWLARPPPAEPGEAERLAPSHAAAAGLGVPPPAASPLALRDATGRRFRRGLLVHSVLQHLPALPAAEREERVARFFAQAAPELLGQEAAELTRTVLGIALHPELKSLFGPAGRAEVPLTGRLGTHVVGGLVDRLAVLPDRVLVADFKTNRRPPAKMEETPPLYLRQLALYRAVLAEIFPALPVVAALVWTETGRVDILPAPLLDRHNPARAGSEASPA